METSATRDAYRAANCLRMPWLPGEPLNGSELMFEGLAGLNFWIQISDLCSQRLLNKLHS